VSCCCSAGRAAPEAPAPAAAPVKPSSAAKSKGKAAGKADAERASSGSGAAADNESEEAAAAGADGAEVAAAAASGGGKKGKKKGKKGAAAAAPEEEKPVDEEALQVGVGAGVGWCTCKVASCLSFGMYGLQGQKATSLFSSTARGETEQRQGCLFEWFVKDSNHDERGRVLDGLSGGTQPYLRKTTKVDA
jgi:hypothetical protein